MSDMFTGFLDSSGLHAGMSERSDGSMVWWNSIPVDESVKKNRDAYFRRVGIDPSRVVSGGLCHGTRVLAAEEKDTGAYVPDTDALITNVPGLFVSITGADCMPIFFCDPLQQCVGIAHAGWRGLLDGIAERVIEGMQRTYGSHPEDVHVAYGPHIGQCHFEVGAEVADRFGQKNIEHRDGRLYASLRNEATLRLTALGVRRIHDKTPCTYCESDRFYSARRDKEIPLKGMAAYIGLYR